MNDEIIRLREELVGLSSDPIKTRELLDKLEGEVLWENHLESPIHIGKKDIIEEKDFDAYKISKTADGQYLLHYKGGYSVLVDEKLLSTASALQQIMDGVPADASDEVNKETGMSEKDGIEVMLSAAEMVFRLPMFVLSHEITTLNIATMGTMYINLLQKLGEVPTAETDNPEYDKALAQMSEFMDNFAAGLEKEGKEYERRMGYVKTETESQSEGKDDNQSQAQA